MKKATTSQSARTRAVRATAADAMPEESARATAAKPRAAAKPVPGPTALPDQLTAYFRDLAVHDLLDAEQERALSFGIEEQEVQVWEQLFAVPDIALAVIASVLPQLDEPVDFSALVKAATAAKRANETADTDAKYHAAVCTGARQMRATDLDRVHADAALRELDNVTAIASQGEPTWLPDATSADFAERLDRAHQAHLGAAAMREEFVRANLRLVVTMARRYDRGGMPISDLIQEGNLGLMHAVARFDHRRGLRFSTYACWWIRHAIGRALADKARAVRIPVHMLEAQQQLEKVRQQQTRELGRPPTPDELARAARMPLAKLGQMHRYLMGSPISLDKPLHDDDDRSFADVLADPASEENSMADTLTTRGLSADVKKYLHLLTPIEADVVTKRFGLRDDEERTFREIGDEYKLSRERIRQIQNAALDKLKRALVREHRGHVEM